MVRTLEVVSIKEADMGALLEVLKIDRVNCIEHLVGGMMMHRRSPRRSMDAVQAPGWRSSLRPPTWATSTRPKFSIQTWSSSFPRPTAEARAQQIIAGVNKLKERKGIREKNEMKTPYQSVLALNCICAIFVAVHRLPGAPGV